MIVPLMQVDLGSIPLSPPDTSQGIPHGLCLQYPAWNQDIGIYIHFLATA